MLIRIMIELPGVEQYSLHHVDVEKGNVTVNGIDVSIDDVIILDPDSYTVQDHKLVLIDS